VTRETGPPPGRPSEVATFHEATGQTPIRDLRLAIDGTPLAPLVAQATRELEMAGVRRLTPRFYLSTEWGVPFGTIAVAIPFYLARPDLTRLHAERTSHVEGESRADILRYLRHELGHAVGYAYRLYERADWVECFGPITRPYVEEYRPSPFSRNHVRHLPGWYAQKHPDEDWAETFAVRITPGRDWRAEYAPWPRALAKLELCDRLLTEIGDRDPEVTAVDLDEDVADLDYSVDHFYREGGEGREGSGEVREGAVELPGLDGALRATFEDLRARDDDHQSAMKPAGALIRALEKELVAAVFKWTGHFPERTRRLVRHLAARADALAETYPAAHEQAATTSIVTFVTALAMSHVHRGTYLA
jgi:hypothetical protein